MDSPNGEAVAPVLGQNPVPLEPPTPRGNAWVGWLAVALLAGGFVAVQTLAKSTPRGKESEEAASLVLLEIRLRTLVGMPQLVDANAADQTRQSALGQLDALDRGSVDQRLRIAMALSQVKDAATAAAALTRLRERIEAEKHVPSEAEAKRLDALERLFADYVAGRPAAPTVSPEERQDIESHFGWVGALALNVQPSPERDRVLARARATASSLSLLGVGVVVLAALGAGSLLFVTIGSIAGLVRSRLGPPVRHHAVYVETFALWLALYLAMLFGVPLVPNNLLPPLAVNAAAMALSLAALAWPVKRGVPWRQVRADIGWTAGQPLVEPGFGFVTYFFSLPLLFAGMAFSLLVLSRLVGGGPAPQPFDPDRSMTHPLIEQFSQSSANDVLLMILLVSVAAPIVEETMFRGVLYRHLRDATRSWGALGGFFFSMLVSALIFAAVHPQGLHAIPMLASLACGFTIAREWRGTLIPSMIAHGLSNGLIVTALILMSQ